jgi:alkylation response protein AidB-like acyl-CoA dehydrogenase
MGSLAVSRLAVDDDLPSASIADQVAVIARKNLAPQALAIDEGTIYPEELLRRLGDVGAWGSHQPANGAADLRCAIQSIAALGEVCGATAFMAWCQNTLVWYASNSDNPALVAKFADKFASGQILGGTGLSNPMKSFFGIEGMRLKGRRVDGGYVVRGLLPFVSNLGADHYFGAVFAVEDGPKRTVMAVVPCASEGLTLADNTKFVALDGTRTFAVQMRDVMIPDAMVLADPCDVYVKRIRAGFVLLQAGMAFGLIRDCINLMQQVKGPLGHVNKYLDVQPERVTEQLLAMEGEVATLATTPFETDPGYWRAVIEARLAASELSITAAHGAMLHCGARGYVANAAAQRRLREAYFVAIVTPATKQLKKMLADMAH